MADFPKDIFSPREKENKEPIEFDPDDKITMYAEDFKFLDEEVIASQKYLGKNEEEQDEPVKDSVLTSVKKGFSKWSQSLKLAKDIIIGGKMGIGMEIPEWLGDGGLAMGGMIFASGPVIITDGQTFHWGNGDSRIEGNSAVKTIKFFTDNNCVLEINENIIKFEKLKLTNLPTSDPLEEGIVWNDGGTLKISAG